MFPEIETTQGPICFNDTRIAVQLAATAADAEARIAAAQPGLIEEGADYRTYACRVTDCTYECAFLVLSDGRLRATSAAAGICLRALQTLTQPPA